MAGKLYKNHPILSKAFAEGKRDNYASNPFPAGSENNLAWAAGKASVDGDSSVYGGTADCVAVASSEPDKVVATPATAALAPLGTQEVVVSVVADGDNPIPGVVIQAASNATSKATVSPSMATADASGEATFTITGVAAGTANVAFTYGELFALCAVTVS